LCALIDDVIANGYYYAMEITCISPIKIAIIEHEVLSKAIYTDPSIFRLPVKVSKVTGIITS